MNFALLLRHGLRENAASEVTRHPHLELLASDAAERQRLKVLADQLKAFGSIPFSYHEVDSIDHSQHGAVMRIALGERPTAQS